MEPRIGVLGLQGAFEKHLQALRSLGVEAIDVRKPKDLECCNGLILPGGESTTMTKQLKFIEMIGPLKQFASEKPVFGTCAGLILLSSHIDKDTMEPLGLIDVTVERNAFGRQVESFTTPITIQFPNQKKSTPFNAVFIRAPRIRSIGENVSVLACYDGEPVLVQQDNLLGATFHPELTSDTSVHAYFVSLVRNRLKGL